MGQIDIWIMLGKIEFEWFSAHAEVLLKAVGRKPSGVGSSVVFHARTLRKPLDILTHRVACAAPLTFADYQEMRLHQCPGLTVLGYYAANMTLSLCYLPWRSSARTRHRAGCITAVSALSRRSCVQRGCSWSRRISVACCVITELLRVDRSVRPKGAK
jgi:hypothetical protein